MPVISVLNQKGGSGKTTLATNLAHVIQRGDYSVNILDADPQRTASEWSRLHPGGPIFPKVLTTMASTIRDDVSRAVAQFVIVDGAPTLDALNVRAVKVSDLVLVPVRASAPDIWSGEDLLELIQERRKETGGEPRAAFVISQQVARTNLASEIGEVLEDYPLPVLEGRTSHRVAYAEALSSGNTVLTLPGAGKAESEIHQIAREVFELIPQTDE